MNKLQKAMELAQSNPDLAMREVCEYLNENPKSPDGLATAAYIEMQAERFGLAWNLIEQALKHWPNNAPLLNNAGMCALGCMKLDEAEQILRRALKIEPDNIAALNNLALVKVNKCEPEEAIKIIDKADSFADKDPFRTETRGYAALLLGRYREGWRDFEGALEGKIRRLRGIAPRWDGKPCNTLVVRGEQGIGDEVSFASVITSIQGVERVVIECDSRLERLFERSFPDCVVYGTRFDKNPYWLNHEQPDAEILMGSLCKYYRNEVSEYPGKPYLKADPERVIQWKALLGSLGDKPKIGISWTGGKHNTHSERRSLSLTDLLPILKQDATFVSLQYKECQEELDGLEAEHGVKIHNWARATQTKDYDDTAALVDSLDLVITVQTASVHLAGGLGKEVWAMIPSKPLWRYGLKGDGMPWYKSVKLYRQATDWKRVVNKVSEDLNAYLRKV